MIPWNFFIFLLVCIPSTTHCQSDPIAPPTTGNFANKKQPSPHFGFGQNIVPEQTFISYLSFLQDNIAHKNFLVFLPEWVYGITDYLSLYASLPIFTKTNLACPHGGVGDLLMQLEYALYQRTTSTYSAQATIVGNITIPTAHISSINIDVIAPPIGFDAPTFFIGATASYLSPQWYVYTSSGATITTPSKINTKFGNIILYQAGAGYNLGNPGGITLLGYLEFSGIFTQQTKINTIKNPNSGGNVIFLGPCIYATHDQWEFWGGIQAPIIQNLNGIQNKERYKIFLSISITL